MFRNGSNELINQGSCKNTKLFYLVIVFAVGVFCNGLTGCSLTAGGNVNFAENAGQATTRNDETTNENVETADQSISKLTDKDVQNLIKFWENAQDAGDFEGYRNCYAKPFKGVKTVSKSSREYDYDEWMNDRRKMFDKAVGLDVEIKNLQISITGETATAEFEQYHRSKNYSDWGPKVFKVKQTPAGAKIVYELLKASYPL